MSTGYTDSIKNGITFKQFALNCARAFGACVTMRDEPMDEPIPDEFKPSNYHKEEIKRIQERLVRIKSMFTIDIEIKTQKEYESELKGKEDSIKKSNDLFRKYTEMLSQVKMWIPPSDEHKELKQFMIDQIEKSIEFDCSDYYLKKQIKLLPPQEWKEREIEKLLEDLDYHTKEDIAEKERIERRNRWIKQLRESLG